MSEDEDPFGLKKSSDELPQMVPESSKEEPSNQEKEAEFLGQSGLQVTGQSRMEAAYGSGDGDDDGTAVVAKTGSVESGTIFHQVGN